MKARILILLALLLTSTAAADLIVTPMEIGVNVERGETVIVSLNVTNNGTSAATLSLGNIYGDTSKDWISVSPPTLSVTTSAIHQVLVEIQGDADEDIDTYTSFLYFHQLAQQIQLEINLTTKYPPYYIVEPDNYRVEENDKVCWADYCLTVDTIDNNRVEFVVEEDGDEIDDYNCDEDEFCSLEDEFGIYVDRVRDEDYAKITILSEEEGEELSMGGTSGNNILSSQVMQTNSENAKICIDDDSQWLRLDKVSFRWIEFTQRERVSENKFRCNIQEDCEIGEFTVFLESIDTYNPSTLDGTIRVSMYSDTEHYPYFCTATNPTGTGSGTGSTVSGDLILQVQAGEVAPTKALWVLIQDKAYNFITSGTVTVDANTKNPIEPISIGSDGMVKIYFPSDMTCPVKITGLSSGYTPTSIFFSNPACDDDESTNSPSNIVNTTASKRLGVTHTGNGLRLDDETIILVTSSNQPVQGVQVNIRMPDNRIDYLTTDSKGEVSYILNQHGQYKVKATHINYLDPSNEHVFNVQPKELVMTLSTNTPKPDEFLTVTVTSKSQKINDVNVKVTSPSGEVKNLKTSSGEVNFQTDEAGKYKIISTKENHETKTIEINVPKKKMDVSYNPLSPSCGMTLQMYARDKETDEEVRPDYFMNLQRVSDRILLPDKKQSLNITAKLDGYSSEIRTFHLECVSTLLTPIKSEYKDGDKLDLQFTRNTDIELYKNGIRIPTTKDSIHNITLNEGNYTLSGWSNMPEGQRTYKMEVKKGGISGMLGENRNAILVIIFVVILYLKRDAVQGYMKQGGGTGNHQYVVGSESEQKFEDD